MKIEMSCWNILLAALAIKVGWVVGERVGEKIRSWM
jgi:hypothetical protein